MPLEDIEHLLLAVKLRPTLFLTRLERFELFLARARPVRVLKLLTGVLCVDDERWDDDEDDAECLE